MKICQKFNKSVIKLDSKTYQINYAINGRMYKLLVKQKRGPKPVLLISDEEMNDVTDEIIPFMGPSYDWYGKEKPDLKSLKKKSLVLQMTNGDEITFETED